MAGDTEQALSRALARASWRLLPLIGVGYCLAYMDRVNISFAEKTMSAQLHFTATVYGTGAGVFFLSYAAAALPSNLLLARFGPKRWLSAMMVAWGLIAAAMMLVRTPVEFYAMRFALGAAEGGFFPGVIYTLTLWFPSLYRGRAVSRFYVAAPLATLVMGAIAGAILKLDGAGGLAGWQWLFLIEGLPACLMGAVMFFRLSDTPALARWLPAPQQSAIGAALTADAAARPPRAGGPLIGALADPAVLAIGVANLLTVGLSYAIVFSAPRLLQEGANLTPGQSGGVVAASGLIGAGTMLGWAWSSDRRRDRFGHLSVAWITAAAAVALMALAWTRHLPGWLLISGYLAYVGAHFAAQGVFWAATDRLLAPAQAAAGIAVISTIGMIGSFVAPILWGMAKDATGDYGLGLACIPAGLALAAAIPLWLRRRQKTATQPASARSPHLPTPPARAPSSPDGRGE